MTHSQTIFTRALLDPDAAVPDGLTDPQGRQAGKRFHVYRNNVAVSLISALETAFPVVRKLVGDEFFAAMAGVYFRQYPPKSPLMMFYGEEMPAFLQEFAPVAHLGYLPDIAHVELALRLSYHAADTRPVLAKALADMSPEVLMATKLEFAPCVHLIRSRWPIYSIWQVNTDPDAVMTDDRAQDVLITRPEFDPRVVALSSGAAAFVAELMRGASFGAALDTANAADKDFDLTAIFGTLVSDGAIAGISKGTSS